MRCPLKPSSLRRRNNEHYRLWQLLGAAVFVAAWQLLAVLLAKPYILPDVPAVLAAAARIFSTPDALRAGGHTLLRWLLGLTPALLFGVTLGSLSAGFKRLGGFLTPLFSVIKSIPIVAVILLAIVWLDAPAVPSFAVFLAAFPSACENSAAGVRNVDIRLLQMADIYKFSPGKRVFQIYLPSIKPYVAAAVKTASGVGLKAVVVAELVVQPAISVGANMQLARVTLQTDVLMAWTLLVILAGFLLDGVFALWSESGRAKTEGTA